MGLPTALPHLNGRRGTIVRALYFALLLLTLIELGGSSWFNYRDMFVNVPSAMRFGFKTYTAFKGGPVVGELVSDEARAQGMIRQSRFVSVDDWVLPTGANEFDLGERLASDADGRVTIVTETPDGARHLYQLTRQPGVWSMIEPRSTLPVWAYSTITFLSLQLPMLLLVGASLILALRRPRDPEALLFAAGFLFICFQPGSSFWLQSLFRLSQGLFAMISDVGFGCLLLAITGFPDGRFTTRVARWTAVLLGIITLLSPLMWMLVERLFSVLIYPLIFTALFSVWMRFRRSDGGERQQIKWAVLGFVAAMTILIIVNVGIFTGLIGASRGMLPYLLWMPLGSIAVMLMPLGLLVSLMRYRLYDAEAAISRSASYAVLTVSLLGIFGVSEKVIEELGADYFTGSLGTVAGAAAAGLAAVAIAPLHHRLTAWAEKRFQQGLVRLRRGLPVLVGDMRETASVRQIAETVAQRVEAAVRAQRVAVLVDDEPIALHGTSAVDIAEWRRGWVPPERDGLDCVREDPLFPMRVALSADGCGRVGWLLLGPRPDGSFYGKDEREALAEVADPIARALAIAKRREAEAQAAEAVTTGLRARIASLEATMARLIGGAAPEAAE